MDNGLLLGRGYVGHNPFASFFIHSPNDEPPPFSSHLLLSITWSDVQFLHEGNPCYFPLNIKWFFHLANNKKCFGVVFKTVLKTSLEPVMSHNQYFNICFDCQFLQNRLENVFLIALSPVIKQYFCCVLRQNNRSFCGLFPSSLDVDQKSRKSAQFLIYPPSFYFQET